MTPTFKNKVLEFDLTGEGNLPSVFLVRPALRNSEGSPMLPLRRVLVGRRRTLPLVLLNDGNVSAQVKGGIFLDVPNFLIVFGILANILATLHVNHFNKRP